jgi:hypothetical protein
MTLVLTVPQRLSLMAYDSSTQIVHTDHFYVETFDDIQLPAIVIEDDTYEGTPEAAELVLPTESYKMILVSDFYGQGADHEAQTRVRTISRDVLAYFNARKQLQFTNSRSRTGQTKLGPLAGVKTTRLLRGPLVPITRGESRPVWGCEFTVWVEEIISAKEVLEHTP